MNDYQKYRLVSPGTAAITNHLVHSFQIPPGGELAWALDWKAPACNHTAVRYWVHRQLADIASDPVDNLLVALEQRLLSVLQDVFPDAGGAVDIPSERALQSTLPLPRWERTVGCSRPKAGRGRPKSTNTSAASRADFQEMNVIPTEEKFYEY